MLQNEAYLNEGGMMLSVSSRSNLLWPSVSPKPRAFFNMFIDFALSRASIGITFLCCQATRVTLCLVSRKLTKQEVNKTLGRKCSLTKKIDFDKTSLKKIKVLRFV